MVNCSTSFSELVSQYYEQPLANHLLDMFRLYKSIKHYAEIALYNTMNILFKGNALLLNLSGLIEINNEKYSVS